MRLFTKTNASFYECHTKRRNAMRKRYRLPIAYSSVAWALLLNSQRDTISTKLGSSLLTSQTTPTYISDHVHLIPDHTQLQPRRRPLTSYITSTCNSDHSYFLISNYNPAYSYGIRHHADNSSKYLVLTARITVQVLSDLFYTKF